MRVDIKDIEHARQKVHRRQQILLDAVREYDEAVSRTLEAARVAAMSRPLKVVEMARLLECHPSTVNRMGANRCRTYAELWAYIKNQRPDLLKTLEANYQEYFNRQQNNKKNPERMRNGADKS